MMRTGIGSKLIIKPTGGYLFLKQLLRQQVRRRRRPFGAAPFWSGVAVSVLRSSGCKDSTV